MERKFILLLIAIIISCKETPKEFKYPPLTNQLELVEKYGLSYKNEFSNIEEFNNSRDFDIWLKKQDSISELYFDHTDFTDFIAKDKKRNAIGESRPKNIKRCSNGLYYYTKDSDTISLIYSYNMGQDKEQVIFDPSKLDSSFSLNFYEPSLDGNHILITSINENQQEIVWIYDVGGKNMMNTGLSDFNSDLLDWVQWLPNDSFVYTGFPNTDSYNDAYVRIYNSLNGKTAKIYHDKLNSHRINPDAVPIPYFYLKQPSILFVYEANASEHYDCYSINISSLIESKELDWEKTFDKNDSIIYYADFRESHAYFKQVKDGEIVLANSVFKTNKIQKPTETLIKSKENENINDFFLSSQGTYFTLSDGITQELWYKNKTDITKIPLDYPIGNIEFKSSWGVSDSISIRYEGWNKNLTEFLINKEKDTYRLIEKFSRKTVSELGNIEVEVIEVESHDGVFVPLTIIKPDSYIPSKDSKAIVLTYGAYGDSFDAYYETMLLDFVAKNNVLAVAHVRGGGEKGHKWYQEGIKDKKENSWRDLIACAEVVKTELLANGHRLGILVESAGGISAGMAINERPGLFKAMAGINLTLNPIRIANNENYTEDDNAYDFGTVETKEGFQSLLALDPVVNINKKADYPATYLICGDEDELIPISEPSKYIAILQSIQKDNTEPILLDVNYGVGHDYADYTIDFGKVIFFLDKELSK